MSNPHELTAQQLYHACDVAMLGCDSTADLPDLESGLGQARALGALHFGVGIQHEGYNLYVMGSPGLGKHAIVRQLLAQQAAQVETPSDWCYVNNFRTPHKPGTLRLPAGTGAVLQADMRTLVRSLLVALPAAFDSDEYRNAMQTLKDKFKAREEQLFGEVESAARAAGIVLLRTPAGFTLAPLKDGEVLDAEAFDKLSAEERQQIDERSEQLRQMLRQALHQVATASREHDQQVEQLNEAVTRATVERQFADLEARYATLAQVTAFLAEVKRDIIEKGLEIFGSAPAEQLLDRQRLTPFNRYFVNVLVDNGASQGAPLIYEDYPSYQNLIGRIEHQAHMGALHTDFTLIKGGALHRANGGYLLLDARKLLTTPFAWEALKRALQARELRIQSLEQVLSLASTISLEPDPIPLDVKVVLIGDRWLYYLLTQYDPEFPLLFKVEADFAEDFPRSAENTQLYARLIATLQRREQLRPLDSAALARMIEQAAREAADGEKLSLHQQDLLDLLREADYWAGEQQHTLVRRDDVERAVAERLHRADQIRERLLEATLRDLHHIDTSGSCVAQINGLAVLQLGAHAFGHPARISATARLGDGKLIDIEREVELGGALHSKGVLILGAYLASRYGGQEPLSFSASLVFEQSYGGVEGDSASAAELCVLQSALAALPLRQDLAITGSVDQHGRMQVIGGVNEKIEGFFDLCAARGLTGSQGVIIPQGNIQHLMLRRAVVEAVAGGRFHVYAVAHADQAMELLTGQPAGSADAQGRFPAGTVNGAVQQRLRELSELRQRYAHPQQDGPAGNGQTEK
ncbi:lon-related putative ATP-dependent protease [Geopseudomonas sagittaria]|uniref:endopeptidase La n=1 Tax=Geopseudomonas sagittaria TaxID=1135990 RepID=A0A1I5TLB5_9GAMM|nr:ATP-binding protein [Pseudomonas sagittaria]SFP83768.1 lon-related putative ATP-dependent protease [Pseudomonas sagittaria]